MLRDVLIQRILGALTEQDLAQRFVSAEELEYMTDLDLFELYEDAVFSALL